MTDWFEVKEPYKPSCGDLITLPRALWEGNQVRLYEIVSADDAEAGIRAWGPGQHAVFIYSLSFLRHLGMTHTGNILHPPNVLQHERT
jgi:hypothetical protein